jgi:hypothetical protein
MSLLSLLRTYFRHEATDPRDKLYALLSLANTIPGDPPISPDYTKNPGVVYQELTLHIINSTHSLRILVGSCAHHMASPSWVTNWSKPPDRGSYYSNGWSWKGYDCYAATKTSIANAKLQGPSFLRLEGSFVDSITLLGDLFRQHSDSSWRPVYRNALQMRDFQRAPNEEYTMGGNWEDAYWRTLCGDIISPNLSDLTEPRRIQAQDRAAYQLWKKFLGGESADMVEDNPCPPQIEAFGTSFQQATTNRKLFLTKEGYLGLGPREMQVGDQVYLINGSNVPFVLRPRSDTERREHFDLPYKFFDLVGNCYVHGIMDGELYENDPETRQMSLVLC